MLAILSEYGEDASSDYNDGDDVMGYFGWSIDGDVLSVSYTPDGGPSVSAASWRLVPVEDRT